MSIVVESQGLYDTIQDRGRPGHRSFGVPLGGWFDATSAACANALAGNDPDAACVEITLHSGAFRANGPIRIAVAGLGAVVTVSTATGHERIFDDSIAIELEPGDRFRVHHPRVGLRSYVAAAGGGWSGVPVLGSVSTESRLTTGQVIESKNPLQAHGKQGFLQRLAFSLVDLVDDAGELAFVPSGEFAMLGSSTEAFDKARWKMSDRSDRVGVRFEAFGSIYGFTQSIDTGRLSAPVVPGTIQWTGSEAIVLGVAGGTMGGYPVLGTLVRNEIDMLARLRPGAVIRFRPVSLDEAWAMSTDFDRKLSRFLAFVRMTAGCPA